MDWHFGRIQITLLIFLGVSSISIPDSDWEDGPQDFEELASDSNITAVLAPLSLPETYLRRGALPPPHRTYDSQGKLSREYRLEDFMWTGSGEGPFPAEDDGGLAWEDNGDQPDEIIRVTKTMILYSTVLTTVIPVELTPTVVVSTPALVDSSALLEASFSSNFFETSRTPGISATPTMSPTLTVIPSSAVPTEMIPTPSADIEPEISAAASTNRLYWVNTVIKANSSLVKPYSSDFQGPMQKNLARVYASAFKRHLMSSLGVMKKDGDLPPIHRKRKRRSTKQHEREDLDFEWVFLKEGLSASQIKSLATTTMNVSVSIVNVTSDPSQSSVSMNYIVIAEGNPVPGSSAVQDLDLVTKSEMEHEIGYEVITKAEALVSYPSKEMSYSEKAGISPWLIVAIAAIFAFIVSLIGLTYFAWKTKRSAISDNTPGPSRSLPGIEGGVINPVFLGSPSRVHLHSGRSEKVLSETSPSPRKDRRKIKAPVFPGIVRPESPRERQKSLASELRNVLSKGESNDVLPSSVKNASKSSGSSNTDKSDGSPSPSKPESASRRRKSRKVEGEQDSKKESFRKTKTEVPESRTERKDSASRRQRRRTGVVDSGHDREVGRSADAETGKSANVEAADVLNKSGEDLRPLSASRDKVTLGHLDICEDPVSRSGSAKSRRTIPGQSTKIDPKLDTGARDSLKDKRKSQSASSLQLPETIDEVTDLQTTDGEEIDTLESLEEKDREVSESLEEFGLSDRPGSPHKKDAQVQTPTRSRVRVKTKPKPKPRTTRPHKLSSESVYLTEAEEIFETTRLGESSGESNPLGRMRKRFHQFLDDAFNVMGKKEDEDDGENARPKSAKVSVTHEIEKREVHRPYSTHVIHEESVQQTRPKSASQRRPRSAWTDSSERRCHSAKSQSSTTLQHLAGQDKGVQAILERDEKPDDSDVTSTTVPTTSDRSYPYPQPIARSSIPLFPHYPIYPDIPMLPGPSHAQASTDPAVPLIQAIKDEIKRFEKVKLTDEYKGTHV